MGETAISDARTGSEEAGRGRLFYGWWVVICCVVISFFAGGLIFGITAFFKPIADEFKWTYLAISLATSVRTVELGILAPVAGFLSDRFGPRKVTFVGGIIAGFGLILLSRTNSLFDFYMGFIAFSIGFSASGQAVLTTAVANWFRRRIGLATGLSLVGYGAGGILVPVIAWMVATNGWRSSLTVLAVATWLVMLPTSLMLRHKPEQYGMLPDGDRPKAVVGAVGAPIHLAETAEFTVRRALRTRVFWLLAVVFFIQFGAVQTVTIHIMPFGASVGMSEPTAALMAMCIPLTSVVGRLTGGWLGDRAGQARILAISLLSLAIGLAFLYPGRELWQNVLFLFFFGPAFGGTVVMRAAIVRQYFGRRAFGSIQGLIIAAMTVGGLVGPTFVGWMFDVQQSYRVAWIALLFACLVAAAMVFAARKSLEKRLS